MRDYKFTVIEDVGLDIDIINGEPVYLDYERQTNDQRASVACYMCKGTIPGREDLGISWADQYGQENTILQLCNEVQQAVNAMAGSSDSDASNINTGYNAQVVTRNGDVGVIITRS